MPKQKSHKGLLKRVKITAGGKLKHRKSGKSHLNSGFSGDKCRKRGESTVAPKSVAKKLERLLNAHLTGR
ncbi:MAG: large ribosomal subunit protein bL35 [Planctomycetota bacterium]|jgi:large subunit ribosomal protein L35